MHHSFLIGDILCEGCSGAIQDIIRHADPAAQIAMDMDSGRLEIDSQLALAQASLALTEATAARDLAFVRLYKALGGAPLPDDATPAAADGKEPR